MKKVYLMTIDFATGEHTVMVQEDKNAHVYLLPHVVHHSSGLSWGYGGSGPADLALSILADHFDEKPSRSEIRHGNCECWGPHQEFKWAYIASKPQYKDFEITSSEIEAWLEDYYSTAKTDDWLEMAYEDANGCGRED